jgi:hypothetical protein
MFKLNKNQKMVEAERDIKNKGSAILNIAPVDKANALGLFRESELNVHIDIVLGSYISESEQIA